MAALTAKQQRFIEEYLVDLNATQAAIRAGYAESGARTEGARLLANADIEKAVEDLKLARSKRIQVTADMVAAELAKLGFSNMQDYMRAGPDGMPFLDFGKLTRDQAAALQEVTVDTIRSKGRKQSDDEDSEDGSDDETVRRVKFKLADKRAALADLGRHLGMFVDRHEHSGPGGGAIPVKTTTDVTKLTDEQNRALASIPIHDG